MIDGAMYEDTVRERVMLYSFVRHLAYHAKRLSSQRDIRHLQEVAHLYSKQAEEMFRCWEIPKRFLAFGDTEDLQVSSGLNFWTTRTRRNPTMVRKIGRRSSSIACAMPWAVPKLW